MATDVPGLRITLGQPDRVAVKQVDPLGPVSLAMIRESESLRAVARADRLAANPELVDLHDNITTLLGYYEQRETDCQRAGLRAASARHSGAVDILRTVQGEVERLMNVSLARVRG